MNSWKPGALNVSAGVLIIIIATLVYLRRVVEPEKSVTINTPSMSSEEKKRIRNFWDAYRRARQFKQIGRWKEAIPLYKRALELDPDHEDSLYNLANSHFELGEYASALELFRRLVVVNTLSQRGHHQIGLILSSPHAGELFDLDAARQALERAFEINKEETGSLLRLGEVALAQGDTDKAFEFFTLANQSNFRAVEGYYLRAYLRWKAGKESEALELLAEAIVQSKTPKVFAGVPGEGDTHPGSLLPPTTVESKRLLKPFWSGLLERYPEDQIKASDLENEFSHLEAHLAEIAARK